MGENLEYLRVFAQFPVSLRHIAKRRVTLESARAGICERMAHRAENLLNVFEHSIFGNPTSPYLPLLKGAGCELGDVQKLVKEKGIEGTLVTLRAAGVYVTFEEFKGRKPIERNGRTYTPRYWDFNNPHKHPELLLTTGGSSGAAQNVGINLESLPILAQHDIVMRDAFDLTNTATMIWTGILPSGTTRAILRDTLTGNPPKRWFSQIGWHDSKSWLKYDFAQYYVLLWMRLYGIPAPFPEYVPSDQPLVVARAVAEMKRKYGKCAVSTNVSRALRVCLAADEAGVDISGSVFYGTAEPVTPGKLNRIAASGVKYLSKYAMTEAGSIGNPCANPAEIGDVHLLKDCFAFFSHPYHLTSLDITVPAFNITALLPTAPKILLNVQMDDYGIVEERRCGCALEAFGFTTHIRQIRSYSKLTGEGITLIGNEIIHILDQVLPARFGGSALDYQLSEQEDAQGFTRLYILISPRVQLEDEHAVVQVMLDALRASSPMADAARTVMEQARTLQVKRMEPILTSRGKLLPLHIERRIQDSARTSELQ